MIESIQSLPAYQALIKQFAEGVRQQPALGLPRAARLAVLSALHHDLACPILYITSRADQAITALDELNFWASGASVSNFPEPTPLFYEQAAWGDLVRRDRIQTLTRLAARQMRGVEKPSAAPVIVAPLRAVMTRTMPRRDFILASKVVKIGQVQQPDVLLRHWVELGYQPTEIVVKPGQFARRGGLLDIWPPSEEYPARFDFFGDEVETIRQFDPATQRTRQTLKQLLICPARELLPGRVTGVEAADEEQNEFYIPVAHPAAASLLDYLPPDALILVDDLDQFSAAATEVEEQAVRLREESIAEGTLPADFPIPYISWSEIHDTLDRYRWLDMGRSAAAPVGERRLGDAFSPGERYGGRLNVLMDALAEICHARQMITIVSRQTPRLKELWSDVERHAQLPVQPVFQEGTLTAGWTLEKADGKRVYLLTDSEIFGWERPKPRQKRAAAAEAPEALYADLKAGDWVVHIDFGIGRFSGLVRRSFEGSEREYLAIEYEAGDMLYVPVHQADRLSRYVGAEGDAPRPTRLGTPEWSNTRQKVREAVAEVAQEMLELYARRQLAVGYAFREDTPWQQELEASFPYVETDDQLEAIRSVKRDMEMRRPMDRLLCGDVGYGKTEVALRAAFKAVMDGKQVALLVPTTVLAQQHFETFRRRLAPFPVELEMLSRFRKPKEQDQIIRRLGEGKLDIVIGTHRLVQPDVKFKDLGLVIIDEEQRFGVTHKEHLKKLRSEVDVLTLTATPIPRTLYMALTGIRDISTINTPPEERLPVVTHIGPYSSRLVRQAVLRELERGGQVFFVHNRVHTIWAMETHLHHLVPEARVGVAHGQMPEEQLAKVMDQFSQGEVDVLLCTSIIESGLDIPNANTLILDRADTFGLAQLYQLRGRVGRGAQRAYAYFFRHRKKMPTEEGLERLEIIAENSQLGAGYSIAMRDLEMRGAGELLGSRQHGYIAAVGFHLYTRLLAQAVQELKKVGGMEMPGVEATMLRGAPIPVNVELPFSVGIPVEYVPDQNMRLKIYRRLADMQNEVELAALEEEFADRFGPLPESVANLVFQMRVKLLGERIGLASVMVESGQIVMRYPPLPKGVASRDLPAIPGGARAGKNAYWLPVDLDGDWQSRLMETLDTIAENHR
ncbi:MAG: transcription-repair coupling factor [Chloroflexi bacterium]|nr:transcription-repair coupling factor [Chloroflexota bacterium]